LLPASQTCPKLAIRQGIERLGVYQNNFRLMECPDQVLTLRMIDAGLAADG